MLICYISGAFYKGDTGKSSASFALSVFSQIHPLVQYLLPVKHTSLANSLFLGAVRGTRQVCKAVSIAQVEGNTTVELFFLFLEKK